MIAACGVCELFCDGSRMEYLAELDSADGSVVTVAPYNRAFLDTRVITVRAEDYGLYPKETQFKRILLVCEECSLMIKPVLPAGSEDKEGAGEGV